MRKPPQIVDFITLGERVISSIRTPQNPGTSAASGGSPVTAIPAVLSGSLPGLSWVTVLRVPGGLRGRCHRCLSLAALKSRLGD